MDRVVAVSNDLIALLWAVWLVVWIVAGFFVKRTQRRGALGATLLERAPILVGFFLFLLPHWMPHRLPSALTHRLLEEGPVLALVALALIFGGVVFSIWARAHLGRNWSGEVMVKVGHSLITSGPYRWVRHPIYTGMLLALLGTALAIGAPYGFLGTALILIGFIVKLHVEEARMRETFPGAYERYSARTARLIPGVY